jgi:hypothetical protein
LRFCAMRLRTHRCQGHAVALLIDEALRYMPEGCGFDSRCCRRGSSQPATEMSTRTISWEVKAAGA